MIEYGIIGTPGGFDFTSNGNLFSSFEKKIILGRYIDLPNAKIQIYEDSQIIRIKKSLIEDRLVYFVVLYRYAKEFDSTREGAYYGSFIAFTAEEKVAPESILSLLFEASMNCCHYLDNRSKFEVNSFDKVELRFPYSLFSAAPMSEFRLSTAVNKSQYYIAGDGKMALNFLYAFLYNGFHEFAYESVYFVSDQSIISYIKERNALKVLDFPESVESQLKGLLLKKNELKDQEEKLQKVIRKKTSDLINLDMEIDKAKDEVKNIKHLKQSVSSLKKEHDDLSREIETSKVKKSTLITEVEEWELIKAEIIEEYKKIKNDLVEQQTKAPEKKSLFRRINNFLYKLIYYFPRVIFPAIIGRFSIKSNSKPKNEVDRKGNSKKNAK